MSVTADLSADLKLIYCIAYIFCSDTSVLFFPPYSSVLSCIFPNFLNFQSGLMQNIV